MQTINLSKQPFFKEILKGGEPITEDVLGKLITKCFEYCSENNCGFVQLLPIPMGSYGAICFYLVVKENEPKTTGIKCRCGKLTATQELHTCPYQVDIEENKEKYCNCCADCEDNCSDSR